MFLHIGTDTEIPIKNIVCIIDLEKYNSKTLNKNFNASNKILKTSNKNYKSMIITNKLGENLIYLTPISTLTLKKRINGIKNILSL